MCRIVSLLFALVIFGAGLATSVSGQESSVFRYASDPFAEDGAGEDKKEGEAGVASDDGGEGASYDSYASWPTGAKNLVQRKAMYRAQQREMRIAARQWYGYSAARPPVYGNPYYMDVYAPSLWASSTYSAGSLYGPFGWYFPRRSLSAHQWSPSYAATFVR